jgi:hypothetical protein
MIDAQELLEDLTENQKRDVLEHLVPGGEWDRDGIKYFAGSVQGGSGKSFSFDIKKGVGGDFAEMERMTNLIGIWMESEGVDFPTAVRALAEHVGSELVELDARELEEKQRVSLISRLAASRVVDLQLIADRTFKGHTTAEERTLNRMSLLPTNAI